MKKKALLLLGVLFSIASFTQTITINGGTSISKLNWKFNAARDFDLYDKKLLGHCVFVGMEYLDKDFFNLATNIGIVRKGGKSVVQELTPFGEPTGAEIVTKPTIDYFSVNTVVDIKYPIKEMIYPFLSLGPRYDILLKHSIEFDNLHENGDLNSLAFGMMFGGGLKFNLSKIQLGFRMDYYLDFTKVAEWPGGIILNTSGEATVNTLTFGLSVGYRL